MFNVVGPLHTQMFHYIAGCAWTEVADSRWLRLENLRRVIGIGPIQLFSMRRLGLYDAVKRMTDGPVSGVGDGKPLSFFRQQVG